MEENECAAIVYLNPFYEFYKWDMDCEYHQTSYVTRLFSDAIGRAMLHRQAAIR